MEVPIRLKTLSAVLLVGWTVPGLAQTAAPAGETQSSAIAPQPATAPQPTIEPASGVPAMPAPTPDSSTGQEPTSTPPPVQTGPVQPLPTTPSARNPFVGYTKYGTPTVKEFVDRQGSTYIPVDSWIYPAMLRLYSMGYVDSMFLGMRPWTRRAVLHMLQRSEDDILGEDNAEAQEILASVLDELHDEQPTNQEERGAVFGLYSGYTRLMGIGGTPLRDSYHIGQTLVNDYGRPYQGGFNNSTGFNSVNEWKRFSLHVRGEYQHAPSATGYSSQLAIGLSGLDGISPYVAPNRPQATIPEGPLASQNPFRLVDAAVSFHLADHEISFGKSDAWLGPGVGGALAWSNNAENIYSFRINRVEPLYIPYVSRLLGTVRYDFLYGSLKGHTDPNSPYVHSEMFSLRPTSNFEFGFQRTIIFGGKDHTPVTLHNFFKGFFDINDTTTAEKFSREDPGARFSDFNFSYRLPFVRKYATLYLDSITHDDVTPISAPRRAAFRTGLFLSQVPKLRKLDIRAESTMTDQPVQRSVAGTFTYYETIQRQGYTNKGFIFGDWTGREGKSGQAWVTYHLSGNEWVQVEYLRKKNAKDFIGFGTTQNQYKVDVVKRLRPDVELDAWVQYEQWKAPVYKTGAQSDTAATVQVTFYPQLHRVVAAP